jgi:hypothetical protein
MSGDESAKRERSNERAQLMYVPPGLTFREYAAALAMQGLIGAITEFLPDYPDIIKHRPQDVAEIAVVYADALLTALESKP